MRLDGCMRASVAMLALALVALTIVSAAPQPQDQGQEGIAQGERTHFQPAKLFDFANYKQLFKKSYSGVVENMMRFKWFTSRAMRSFISAIKYRFRESKFYLAINHMSDMSEAELDKMRNKKLEEQYASAGEEETSHEQQIPEFVPKDGEDPVEQLRRAIEQHKGEPGFEELRAQLADVEAARSRAIAARRRKRDASSATGSAALPPRELPLANLINLPVANDSALLSAETRAKIRERPTSDNPFYEGIELMSEGLRDQQVPLETISLRAQKPLYDALSAQLSALSSSLEGLRQKYLMASEEPMQVEAAKQPDEVFLDLREKSNCFFAPRSQGACGSCYAFAAIAVAEWLHCKTTGELVPFSEQYVVDCAKDNAAGLYGCNGGSSSEVNQFFQNFGWELRSNYPYMAREQTCPYPEDTDLRTVGYIRGDLRKNIKFDMSAWPEVLEHHGPLVININTGKAFREYGSGVYDACVPKKPTHGVVLIGHGREDGEEYWLIRNSYSVGWGEAGHIKLAKKADCVYPHFGFTFGSDDGWNLSLKTGVNKDNDGSTVKAHYVMSTMQ